MSAAAREYDVAIIGSGAGGGTVAQALAPLCAEGLRVVVLEQGARLRPDEHTGRELEMAQALYAEGGGVLTADRSMTLAMGRTYGGSTAVYTGTSLLPPARVIRAWDVPGIEPDDLAARASRYAAENDVHLLDERELNDNNRLFREGCRRLGWQAEQFPVNVRGCRGASLCNLGCVNGAKRGTNRVQLPAAEELGVEVVTRAEVLRIDAPGRLQVRITAPAPGEKGLPSSWAPGDHALRARTVVSCAGAVGSPALLLRSGLGAGLPRLGEGFTAHPAMILVAEHERPITNFVGHPKSFYLDRAAEEGFLLETCMYFPFTTAKNLAGFGEDHARMLRAFPRLQMILLLACDRATPGNRVEVDRRGAPVVRYRFPPPLLERLARGARAAARIFFAAGALRVHTGLAEPPLVERADLERLERRIEARHFLPGRTPVSAAHLMGGCGMGRGPADSVSDGWGRVHGHPWLFVADASLFPDALEVNPYLTVMALADRVAEAVRERSLTGACA